MNNILSLIVALAVLLPTVAGAGEQIKLRDPQTGAAYGPVEVVNGAKIKVGDKTLVVESVELTSAKKALIKKSKSIIIPEMAFREANVRDAVAFLNQAAKQSDPDKEGVNILVMLPPGDATAQPTLTIELHNVPLYDALRYSCEALGLHMRIDDNAVVLSP